MPDAAADSQSPTPGTVWWCDGAALAFEAYFKRRPILVLSVLGDGTLLVAPLSSKRRFGQEQAVTHSGGVSFLTGQVCEVSADALLSPLGAWEDFEAWRAEQYGGNNKTEGRETPARNNWLIERLRRWLRRA